MINIAELLKDVPKGMKLYSPLFGEVNFVGIDKQSDYPINVTDCKGNGKSFTEFGIYFSDHPDAECLLFPSKDCRFWEGWKLPIEPKFKVGDWVVIDNRHNSTYQVECVREYDYMLKHTHGGLMPFPFSSIERLRLWAIEDAKDGDVLVTTKIRSCPFIYRKTDTKDNLAYYYAGIDGNGDFCEGCLKRTLYHFGPVANAAPATKEQRELLFKKMKEAGYEWDEKKKELRKIEPHYDIANFKPFDKVLVRCADDEEWAIEMFSKYYDSEPTIHGRTYRFMCIGNSFSQCIPYEGNEHLFGTTDPCGEEYINW